MPSYKPIEKFRAISSLSILIAITVFSIVFRTVLGFCIFAYYYTAGTKYEWFYPLPIGIILGFAPWGWKVEAVLKEKHEQRELEKIRSSHYYYSTQTVKIYQSTLLADLFIIAIKLFVNGFLGLLLGWKVCLDMVVEIFKDLALIIRYILD